MKILAVDDDLDLLGLIAFALRQAGYLVIEAQDGPSALQAIAQESPDLIVLDVNLPRIDGLEVLRRLRAGGCRTPVMLLTVLAGEEDQIRGLDLGADDYLTKPFSPRTLLARVRTLLRRAAPDAGNSVDAGEISADPETHAVRVAGGAAVRLTALEFRLLQLLLASAGHTLPPERLVRHVWGSRGTGDRQALKQLVHRLRRKIEPDPAQPRYLLTVAGVGYRLDSAGAPGKA